MIIENIGVAAGHTLTGGKPLPNMANVTYDVVVDGAFPDDALSVVNKKF